MRLGLLHRSAEVLENRLQPAPGRGLTWGEVDCLTFDRAAVLERWSISMPTRRKGQTTPLGQLLQTALDSCIERHLQPQQIDYDAQARVTGLGLHMVPPLSGWALAQNRDLLSQFVEVDLIFGMIQAMGN